MDRSKPDAESSRVNLGAGSPPPSLRGFSVEVPGLAGFGIEPEVYAEGFYGRKRERPDYTVSESGGSGAVGGIGPYLDQLDEPKRLANGGWVSMEPNPYSGPLTRSTPAFQRQGTFGPGIGGLFDSPVSSAADPVSAEVLPTGLTGSGDGGGGGYGDPDPSTTGPSQPGGFADLAGAAATAVGMTTGLGAVMGIADMISQELTNKSLLGNALDLFGFNDPAPFGHDANATHDVAEPNTAQQNNDIANQVDTFSDLSGPPSANEAQAGDEGGSPEGAADDHGADPDDDGSTDGPGNFAYGGEVTEGGVAGLPAALEFKDAGTFPGFVDAHLGAGARADSVALSLMGVGGRKASPQVLEQVSRILNSQTDPVKIFAKGGSVRVSRPPPQEQAALRFGN